MLHLAEDVSAGRDHRRLEVIQTNATVVSDSVPDHLPQLLHQSLLLLGARGRSPLLSPFPGSRLLGQESLQLSLQTLLVLEDLSPVGTLH